MLNVTTRLSCSKLCGLNWFRVTLCTVKLAPEQTGPHFNVFKYDSEGEKSENGVKNIKRMGKKF